MRFFYRNRARRLRNRRRTAVYALRRRRYTTGAAARPIPTKVRVEGSGIGIVVWNAVFDACPSRTILSHSMLASLSEIAITGFAGGVFGVCQIQLSFETVLKKVELASVVPL